MSFKAKHLDFTLTLKNGNFGKGGNTAQITGHRATVDIVKPGGSDMGQMEAAIYGLPLSLMNQLTTLGTQVNLMDKNTVVVKAYEDGQQPTVVFQGTISLAYADMRGMPQVCFRISAHAGLYEAGAPNEPTSVKGSTDVGQTMERIAKQVGLQFENNGVDTKVMNPYLPGNPRSQMKMLAQMAGIGWVIDNGTLAIWPAGKSRKGEAAVIQPPEMVGYPAFTQSGVEVTTLFNPQVKYAGVIEVKSAIKPACGKWNVISIAMALDAEIPNGRWFQTLSTTSVGAQGRP